jgi:hypothetical protein
MYITKCIKLDVNYIGSLPRSAKPPHLLFCLPRKSITHLLTRRAGKVTQSGPPGDNQLKSSCLNNGAGILIQLRRDRLFGSHRVA